MPLEQDMSRISPRSSTETLLDKVFWSRFSREFWERKAATFKNISSPLVELDQAHIFELLVFYSDRCRKLKNPDGLKFYVAGERQHDEEILQILPVRKDKSLQGYHLRMSRIFSDYCLVCDELLQVSFEKWDLLLGFTRDLYGFVGFPHRFAEMGLYLGNYRRTPFGVHVDGCGVFTFPVVGQKKFRIWKPDYVKKNAHLVEAHEYSRYKKNSELLVAGPGDMTYWPSSDWHIAESEGGFSVAWSLGVWVDRSHSEVVAETFKELLQKKLESQGGLTTTRFQKLHEKDGEVRVLPELYSESLALLGSLTHEELREAMLKSWMTLISKQGFKTLPQRKIKRKILLKDMVQGKAHQPIMWSYLRSESRYIYIFNGTRIENATSPSFLKLVKALNSGRICRPDQFLKGAHRAIDLRTLETLAEAGAIDIFIGKQRE